MTFINLQTSEIFDTLLNLIEPQFQSIVSTDGNTLYAVEALCRFRDQDTLSQGLVKQWEKSGYVAHIDMAMLKRVRQCLPQQLGPIDLRLAVNVSVRTIEIAADDYLDSLLHLAPLLRRLIVEITETYRPDDWRVVCDFAHQVNQAGMYVALDDCSPSHMFWDKDFVKVVAPQFLKLDGGLLNDCLQSEEHEPIKSLVGLSRRIGARVIAEHIDSERKRDLVAGLGVGFQQGWFFNKPSPLSSYSSASDQPKGAAALC